MGNRISEQETHALSGWIVSLSSQQRLPILILLYQSILIGVSHTESIDEERGLIFESVNQRASVESGQLFR